jgi:hypothetical protein
MLQSVYYCEVMPLPYNAEEERRGQAGGTRKLTMVSKGMVKISLSGKL